MSDDSAGGCGAFPCVLVAVVSGFAVKLFTRDPVMYVNNQSEGGNDTIIRYDIKLNLILSTREANTSVFSFQEFRCSEEHDYNIII